MSSYIYKITNTITEKVYIGYTSSTVENRWLQHKNNALKQESNRKFYNAIRKYGTDVWTIEVISETITVNEAKEQEIAFIELYDSYHNGYNATKGGDGNNGIIMSAESNMKRSEALKGVSKSPETVEKFRQRRSTPEENAKRSEAHIGMKKPWVKWSNEQIEKEQ
jgi:group I intron endonuclease